MLVAMAPEPSTSSVSAAGRPDAYELTLSLYEHLRGLARAAMRAERDNHTLQATALVHEAVLKLSGRPAESFVTDADYLAAAGEAMRRVLIDHARRRRTQKRTPAATGSDRSLPEDLEHIASNLGDGGKIVVDEILDRLERENGDRELATIVKLRVFAGLTTEEVAGLLGCSRKTVERRWRFAAAMLRDRMGED